MRHLLLFSVLATLAGATLLGPSLASFALDATTHGLPFFVAMACGGFTLFLMCWREPAQEGRKKD